MVSANTLRAYGYFICSFLIKYNASNIEKKNYKYVITGEWSRVEHNSEENLWFSLFNTRAKPMVSVETHPVHANIN